MRGYYIFLAVSACLAILVTYSSSKIFLIFLVFLWFIRLLFLNNHKLVYVSLLVIIFFSWRAFSLDQNNQSQIDESTSEFYMSVKRDTIKIDGDQLKFEAQLEEKGKKESLMVFYQLTSEEEKKDYLEQSISPYVYVRGELKNPGTQRNFHQFDYQNYLRRQKIHWTLAADDIYRSDQGYDRLLDKLRDGRYQLLHLVDRKFSGQLATYIKMLLFSDRRNLSDQVLLDFQNIGIIHILSISGMHISFYIHWV